MKKLKNWKLFNESYSELTDSMREFVDDIEGEYNLNVVYDVKGDELSCEIHSKYLETLEEIIDSYFDGDGETQETGDDYLLMVSKWFD